MSIGPKQALYSEFASVARALGNQHRLEILEHLAQGERGVEAVAERVGLTIANASQHLQQLRRAGLVASRRDGKFVLYRLADEAVLGLMAPKGTPEPAPYKRPEGAPMFTVAAPVFTALGTLVLFFLMGELYDFLLPAIGGQP